ncbi:DUF1801 domain-containing protein [Polaribacter sp. MSW13]|uniref:DUF1801 domain-containing protein n=1 Tax=Polaribacter marinus TaxID=2916838 RepID=A0A9X1VRH4_9FLAO|nr:DUF1801 domain-containing protein [Polaribacter marinus]MCI2229435.1 DUF1801 domain-containing protein [Polaribacter marinus]
MPEKVNSIKEYIAQAPKERQFFLKKLQKTIKNSLPKDFEEGIKYGMIGYYVPHSIYPKGYHCNPSEALPFMSFASQKNTINLYSSAIYAIPEINNWFINEYTKHSTRKLDMGKSCIRFKKLEDIPFDLIAELCKKITVKEWISIYESSIKTKK